jgi:hypothetical protein
MFNIMRVQFANRYDPMLELIFALHNILVLPYFRIACLLVSVRFFLSNVVSMLVSDLIF